MASFLGDICIDVASSGTVYKLRFFPPSIMAALEAAVGVLQESLDLCSLIRCTDMCLLVRVTCWESH